MGPNKRWGRRKRRERRRGSEGKEKGKWMERKRKRRERGEEEKRKKPGGVCDTSHNVSERLIGVGGG